MLGVLGGITRLNHSALTLGVMVNVMVSPNAKMPPNPAAFNVKYGAPAFGLLGALLTPLILPVPIAPNVSPTMVNAVELVNVMVIFCRTDPRLSGSIGYCAWLYDPAVDVTTTLVIADWMVDRSIRLATRVAWPVDA